MENIDIKLDKILAKLTEIELRLDNTSESCNRMDEHIEFVEETYNKLRHPIKYITGQDLRSRDEMSRRHTTLELKDLPDQN